MDFVGSLNFVNPETQSQGSAQHQQKFYTIRFNKPTLIRDARLTEGVMSEPRDATDLLTNGSGFLLVHAPSKVQDWTDIKEVAAIYYTETRRLLQRLLPTAVVPPTSTHTYRNEQFKEHFWENGVQYGPCATGVHNDYADFIDEDTGNVIEKFSEVQGMPQDKRYLGFNIWRSVSPKPLERFPLAVCDRTSIDPGDLEYNLNPNAKPRPFNAHYCKPNDEQRWNYFSAMTKDEALVFTTYDSHPPHNETFCPTLHTAVPIPDSDGLQERNSIEVRFFVELDLPE
ncbi:MAG: CmcJ/NvfI family oxidoreductase [Gammaproteobacteria bacterium]|nr:CmcJ/NvfI family oxidoreductase [Gammaproteobacteria bacterium]